MNWPLVSVTVLTYNSSCFILETLESIKAQSYKNIELIISDDNSKDSTVEICNNWLKKNKDRFVRVQLINSDVNTGIPANKNRAISECRGEWIKGIAGDDIFHPEGIKMLMECAHKKSNIQIIASKIEGFKDELNQRLFFKIRDLSDHHFFSQKCSAYEQFIFLMTHNYIDAPTVLIKRSLIQKLNGYNEKYKRIEDWPFWLKVTSKNIKVHFCNKTVVYYRIHDASVTKNKNVVINKKHLFDQKFYGFSLLKNIDKKSLNKNQYKQIISYLIKYVLKTNLNIKKKVQVIYWIFSFYVK